MKKINAFLGLLAISILSLCVWRPQISKSECQNNTDLNNKTSDAYLNCGGDGGVT